MFSLIKKPSGWIPIAISLAALAFLLTYLSIYGITREEDEGTPARIFQLLMVAQLPVIGFFALKWLPKEPVKAIITIILQILAAIIPVATVFFLEM